MAGVRFAAQKRNRTKVNEWQRTRRSAYSSGRREIIGYERPELSGPKRKMKKASQISARMPFKYKNWKIH